jgi:hypothetical protein
MTPQRSFERTMERLASVKPKVNRKLTLAQVYDLVVKVCDKEIHPKTVRELSEHPRYGTLPAKILMEMGYNVALLNFMVELHRLGMPKEEKE